MTKKKKIKNRAWGRAHFYCKLIPLTDSRSVQPLLAWPPLLPDDPSLFVCTDPLVPPTRSLVLLQAMLGHPCFLLPVSTVHCPGVNIPWGVTLAMGLGSASLSGL